MTVAPYGPSRRRVALTGVLSALLWVLGLWALREYGLGPALFLLALAAVAAVDCGTSVRQGRRR